MANATSTNSVTMETVIKSYTTNTTKPMQCRTILTDCVSLHRGRKNRENSEMLDAGVKVQSGLKTDPTSSRSQFQEKYQRGFRKGLKDAPCSDPYLNKDVVKLKDNVTDEFL